MGKVKAIIDIGTNSIKFHLAQKADGTIKVLKDANNIARLGEGLKETGMINIEGYIHFRLGEYAERINAILYSIVKKNLYKS